MEVLNAVHSKRNWTAVIQCLLILTFSLLGNPILSAQSDDLSWLEWSEDDCQRILRRKSVERIRTGSPPSGRIDLNIQIIQPDTLKALFRLEQLSQNKSGSFAVAHYRGFQQRLQELEMAGLLVFRISAYRTFAESTYQDTHKLPLASDQRPPVIIQFDKHRTLLKITEKLLLEASRIASLSSRDYLIGFPLKPDLLASKKKVWIEIWAVDGHFGETHRYRAQFKTASLLE